MEHPEFIRYRKQIEKGPWTHVIGVDECGAGAWAGPLLVCAAAVPVGWVGPTGLNDSKKLTRKKREALFALMDGPVPYAQAVGDSTSVDKMGLGRMLDISFQEVVDTLLMQFPNSLVVLDGVLHHDLAHPHICLPKADGLVPAVMAASVLGKVTRDREMVEYDKLYPGYDFAKSVGYGTAAHSAGLKKLGVSPLHRRSYAPIRKILEGTV